ncbi:PucR family transcriptional regulator [Pseudalkalibacillus caeni]|uniref:PucR family transcriptional regulator n=1 Tax=Exobacillus caeni TaxID=2574798 RepID=A0A5R9F521_9BACL|nr:PucR family transcriptional regulator [Pseudalkalibacillus caeni]TLS38617.1 PucR family transcriptional regulator [Pseudalkalibacillus caeni]
MFTVNQALEHPLFQKARVVAGHSGLNKQIRWVHILEISNFDTLIRGEEMILATGIGLQQTVASKTEYLKRLISHGAACLCIEIGHYFDSVSEELIRIANEHEFPIIEFRETVRFVDITQEFHSLIINQQYKMLQALEKISFELNQFTLTSKGVPNILKLLQETLDVQVIYLPPDGKTQFVPLINHEEQDNFIRAIDCKISDGKKGVWQEGERRFFLQPVEAMNQVWANLCIVSDKRKPGEFEMLVLDRAAMSIAQDLLRKRYMEERKLHTENLWVSDLIHNRVENEEQVKMQLGIGFKQSNLLARVCLIEIANLRRMETELTEEDAESLRIHIALIVRAIFEKHGFKPVMTSNKNQLVIIAIQEETELNLKDKLSKIFMLIKEICKDKKIGEVHLNIGVGREVSDLTDCHMSYKQAQMVLKVVLSDENVRSYFYDDMGVFRLLLPFGNDKTMQQFIEDHLGPLIEHDRKKGTKLLKTLKVFLDNEGSKQRSAEKLYIVRQTLYHRLEKIKELIGDEFMASERRLSIEVALRAYQLLKVQTEQPEKVPE